MARRSGCSLDWRLRAGERHAVARHHLRSGSASHTHRRRSNSWCSRRAASSCAARAGAHSRAARLAVRRRAGTRCGSAAGCTNCRSAARRPACSTRSISSIAGSRATTAANGTCRRTCARTACLRRSARCSKREWPRSAPTRARSRSGSRSRATRAVRPGSRRRTCGSRTFPSCSRMVRTAREPSLRSTSCCAKAWCNSATRTTCSRRGRWSMRCCIRPTKPRASARTCAWPTSSTIATSDVSAASASCSARAKSGARASCWLRTANERQRSRRLWIGVECGSRSWPSARCARSSTGRRNAGTPLDGIVLRRMLALSCSVYDWGLTEVADAQLLQLCRDSGMAFFAETDASQPDLQRVIECLKRAQQTYEATPAAERGLPPGDAVRDLAACAMPLASALCHTHDATRLRALRRVDRALALARARARHPDRSSASSRRRHARSGARSAIGSSAWSIACWERTRSHEILRRGGAAVYSHIQAVDDARRGHPRALESMTRLVEAGASDDLFLVVHGRWLGHAFRGDAVAAQRFYKQVEAITEDDVWRRKAFLFAEAQLFALTGDLAGAQARGRCDRRARAQVPRLAAVARLHARRDASLARRARGCARRARSRARPKRQRASIAPSSQPRRRTPSCLLQLGDAEGGLREAEGILEQVRALSLDASAEVAAERVRALCENALGRSAAARASIERAFARAAELGFGGLPLAQLHEARARILLDMGEAEHVPGGTRRAAPSHRACRGAGAGNRVRSAARREQAQAVALGAAGVRHGDPHLGRFQHGHERRDHASERRRSAGQRARRALELLLEDSGARSGYLFLCGQAGLFVAAAVDEIDSEEAVLPIARHYLDGELGETMTKTIDASELTSAAATPTVSGSTPIVSGNTVFLSVAEGANEGDALALWARRSRHRHGALEAVDGRRQPQGAQGRHDLAVAGHRRQDACGC